MHDVQSRGTRYSLLAAGFVASLFALIGSAVLNWRYGHALSRTPEDGTIFGVLAIASDVFMAISLFFYFEAKKRRQYTQMIAAIAVWAATTAFAGVAAISQASMNRIDAVAHRAAASTAYADTRTELTEARKTRDKIGVWVKTETAAKTEIEKHKTSRSWTQSSECQEIAGKSQREYCSQYQTLVGELATAQQVAKLDKRIEDLVAKSDTAIASNVSVTSEADPAAATLAGAMGQFKTKEEAAASQRQIQSYIIFGFAGLILTLCSLGPYITSSMLAAHDTAKPNMIEGEATDITPEPEPIRLEVAPLAIAAPPRPKASKIEAQPQPDPTPEWMALLVALGFPEPTWQPPRDKRGDFILREKDPREIVGWRFFIYLQANGMTGEFTPDQLDEAVSRFSKTDFRQEWGSRIVKAELREIRRWVKAEGAPVTWTVKPAPVAAVKQMLITRKMLPEEQPAEAPQDTAVTVTATQAAPEDAKPNGIKAIALRKFFRGTDPASDDVTLN